MSDRKTLRSLTAGAAIAPLAFAMLSGAAMAAETEAGEGTEAAVGQPSFEMLETYCVSCHNFQDWAGGVAFDTMSPDTIGEEAEVWEEVLRKLEGHLMPPPGEDLPAEVERLAFVHALEQTLDEAAEERGPQPGYVTLHRLNRTEYANQIKALFDMEVNVEELLPPDAESDGFTNVANVLQVSPTFLDQYIGAAREITIAAVGTDEIYAGLSTYLAPRRTNHNVHQDGLPLGTRGGIRADHYFPAGGTYNITIGMSANGGELLRAYPNGWLEYEHTAVLAVDGKPVFEANIGGEDDMRGVDQEQQSAVTRIQARFENIPIEVTSGTHAITAAFVARTFAEDDQVLEQQKPGLGLEDVPIINFLEVVGPFDSAGVGDTPSRKKIFSCYPESAAEERPCAEEILTRLGEEAWRRPLEHGELAKLMAFYEAGADQDGFEVGVQKALMAMLSSTNFLYRAERAPEGMEPGQAFALDGPALASRLAFFVWSQGPDEELRELALAGELNDPDVIEAQVDRMLADPRSRALVENFGMQWLGGDAIEALDPDPRIFPNFDEDLREAFHTELDMFLGEVLLKDHSILELLNADYTFVDDRLAMHYGIEDVQGANFRKVELEDTARWGLLGKGALLMGTSYPNRTSPVLRGAWIMETLIGAPPAAPPPGVETNLDAGENAQALTVRARLEEHRADPSCNSCHGVIDPLGMALENFDAIGKWRDIDRFAGVQIDATGAMPGETASFTGPADLREALAAEPQRFARAFTEKLMTYAIGRRMEHNDMPAVREIVRGAEDDDYRFSAIIRGIVESDQFRMKTVPDMAEMEDAQPVDEAALHP